MLFTWLLRDVIQQISLQILYKLEHLCTHFHYQFKRKCKSKFRKMNKSQTKNEKKKQTKNEKLLLCHARITFYAYRNVRQTLTIRHCSKTGARVSFWNFFHFTFLFHFCNWFLSSFVRFWSDPKCVWAANRERLEIVENENELRKNARAWAIWQIVYILTLTKWVKFIQKMRSNRDRKCCCVWVSDEKKKKHKRNSVLPLMKCAM